MKTENQRFPGATQEKQNTKALQHVTLRNARKRTVDFFVEPWGTTIPMPAGAVFEVVIQSTHRGNAEVVVGEDDITLYGWSGAVFAVYCNDEVLAESRVPVPSVPSGVDLPMTG